MRVVVIGATGHIGGYLVPRLVRSGREVIAISRGRQEPYREDPAWAKVTTVVADRDAEDAAGTFGKRIAALEPDVVIDLICFTPESAQLLADALRGRDVLLLMCGTIWVHGALRGVPARESDPRTPWGDYGVAKAAIESLLLGEFRRDDGVPAVVLHPGHISGPGWPVINPAGNLDLGVWERLATGRRVVLPNLGLETLHHVHADDVAQAFELAIAHRERAVGRSFHVVSDRAITLRGFAEAVASWFGQEADLEFRPFDDFRASTTPEHAATTFEHIARSHSMSIDAAAERLGYAPGATSLEAVREALEWLSEHGKVNLWTV